MRYVKLIGTYWQAYELERAINDYLDVHRYIKLIEIQYQAAGNGNHVYHSAMIIYEVNDG